MVELKVRKFGNSLGVVLPKEVIQRLQSGDGEALFLIEASSLKGKPCGPRYAAGIGNFLMPLLASLFC